MINSTTIVPRWSALAPGIENFEYSVVELRQILPNFNKLRLLEFSAANISYDKNENGLAQATARELLRRKVFPTAQQMRNQSPKSYCGYT
jgi:hypothetical protein